jgi:nucleoside-diphosphate-sugar epimerase
VGDYRSPDYDLLGAVGANTRSVAKVLSEARFKAMIVTGSVFEPDEGSGEPPLRAFSPYGLSKNLSYKIFEHFAREANVRLGKFVISNPFGPLEEPKFCAYLMQTWKSGAVASVRTPDYIRDNIHIDLLASAYVRFAVDLASGRGGTTMNPSGYVERQGDFAARFAREMRRRLPLECALRNDDQVDFSEPLMRVNTEPAWRIVPDWNEQASWDAIAEHYQ